MSQPNASFHIVGCVIAAEPDAAAIDECVEWVRRYGAVILSQDDRRAVFVRFDATSGQLILFGSRAALARRPPLLRFSYASAVKEVGADGPRAAERGVLQACDLAGGAQPGQVLVSSQLGSLLQVAEVEPYERLHSVRVPLADGRTGSAYVVEPLRGSAAEPSAG
jgi:hypothetical protein